MNWVVARHHFDFVLLVQSTFSRLNDDGKESSDDIWLMLMTATLAAIYVLPKIMKMKLFMRKTCCIGLY